MQFPLFVSIEGKKIVVVGAGRIAQRRIQTLMVFKPQIVVIAPEISEECRKLQTDGTLICVERCYKEEDLEGAYLVLACTNQESVNACVVRDARKCKILVNRCDKKEDCDFFFPGIAVKGSVVAGVSASGQNHALAKAVTEMIREGLKTIEE